MVNADTVIPAKSWHGKRYNFAELLQKLSDALDYNFFTYYYPAEKILKEDTVQYRKSGKKSSEETTAELTRKLETTKKELAGLQEKYELLKKVNELLEKKASSE